MYYKNISIRIDLFIMKFNQSKKSILEIEKFSKILKNIVEPNRLKILFY